MSEKRISPYEVCPVHETKQFTFRLVEEKDAADLLKCYSDPESAPIFNSDNCHSNFVYETEEEVLEVIRFWLMEYGYGGYVRFSIVDKSTKEAVGTIEIFAGKEVHEIYGIIGLLRLDLRSDYETVEHIDEILQMVDKEYPTAFQINSIRTKIVPEALARLESASKSGYMKLEDKTITTYSDYYIKQWM